MMRTDSLSGKPLDRAGSFLAAAAIVLAFVKSYSFASVDRSSIPLAIGLDDWRLVADIAVFAATGLFALVVMILVSRGKRVPFGVCFAALVATMVYSVAAECTMIDASANLASLILWSVAWWMLSARPLRNALATALEAKHPELVGTSGEAPR